MKKKFLSLLLVLALIIGTVPTLAYADPGSYSTGLGDTATYYADMSAGTPALGGNDKVTRSLVEIDGETFVKFYDVTGNANNYSMNFAKTVYADGKIDQTAVNLEAQKYWAWRIKADVTNGPISFSIDFDNTIEKYLDAATSATFIDYATREAVGTDVVQAKADGHFNITFNTDFDGWMIIDLSKDFLKSYTPASGNDKDFLSDYAGTLQFYFHDNCHGSPDLDWTDAYIAVGDMLLVENLDTFKGVRLSCDELGHVLELNKAEGKKECKYCDYEESLVASGDYSTGLADKATYYADISKGGYSLGSNDQGIGCAAVEIDGESFIKYNNVVKDSSIYNINFAKTVYTDGKIDQTAVNLEAQKYWAWRIKADVTNGPVSFSIAFDNVSKGWLDAGTSATFIDINTREAVTTDVVQATVGGYSNITFNKDFDGWMVVDLSTAFIRGYSPASGKDKDFLPDYSGTLQFYFHDNCHGSPDLDWTNAYIAVSDMLLIENLDTFKEYRLSCDELGHVLELNETGDKKVCKYCDYTENLVMEGTYSTGKPDSAYYYLDMSSNSTSNGKYQGWGGNFSYNKIEEVNGEWFHRMTTNPALTGNSCGNQLVSPAKPFYGTGTVKDAGIDTSKITAMAWRIKVDPAADGNETEVGISISCGSEGGIGYIRPENATFIDYKTRQPVSGLSIKGLHSVYFPAEGFDGWMIIDLTLTDAKILSGYTKADVAPFGEYLLNSYTGGWQYFLHCNKCSHNSTTESDWTDRTIGISDILLVDNLDTFKEYRLSCDGLGHTLEATDDVTAPTCENKGYTIMKCKFCDHTEQGNFVDATGHTWKETGRTQATCLVAEVISYACDVCDATKTETGDYAEHDMVANGNATEATCTTPASYELECSYGCGTKETVKTGEIDPDAHSYKDGVCEHCGATEGEALIQNGENSTAYETFAEALENAVDGDTIKLMKDVNIADTSLTISESITIDFNGKTMNVTFKGPETEPKRGNGEYDVSIPSFMTITEGANVVLMDSTGNIGGIAANNDQWSLSGLITVANGSTLVIESGNYFQKYSVLGKGMIQTAGSNNVTINDGIFHLGNLDTDSNGSPWIFNASGRNSRHINVNGGTFNADIFHQYYVFEAQTSDEDGTKAIRNNGDGTYTVVEAVAYVVEQHGNYKNKVGYATLEEAFAACAVEDGKIAYRANTYYRNTKVNANGETIVLVKDVNLEEDIVVNAGVAIKLELNGYEITGSNFVDEGGNLTIN